MKRLLVVFALALALLLPAAANAQLPIFQLSQELLDFIAAAPAADDLAVGEGKFAPTDQGESAVHAERPWFQPACHWAGSRACERKRPH